MTTGATGCGECILSGKQKGGQGAGSLVVWYIIVLSPSLLRLRLSCVAPCVHVYVQCHKNVLREKKYIRWSGLPVTEELANLLVLL